MLMIILNLFLVRQTNLPHPLSERQNRHASDGTETARRDHKMVEYRDTDDLCRFDQLACEVDILFARCRVTAGVVMGDDDRMGPPTNCLAKYLSRMNGDSGHPAFRHGNRFAKWMKSRIHRKNEEVLLFRMPGDNTLEEIKRRRRRTK